MNSFYSRNELEKIGFAEIGSNVLISRKASIYGANNMIIGNNVRIDDFCILSGKIEMGDYIHIAAHSSVYGGDKGVFFADFCNVSSMVSIYAVNDDYTGMGITNPMVPENLRKVDSRSVLIAKHVIIGTHSVVLPGCVLKEGSAFGAFSFINRDSEEWSINVGIPFKRIGCRSKKVLELEQYLQSM